MTHSPLARAVWLLCALPLGAAAQLAPSVPNAGSLLQQVPPPALSPRPNRASGLTLRQPDGQALPPSAPFDVRGITISGNTLITSEVLGALVADAIGQPLTLPQLEALAARITQAYQRRGYPLARAIVPAQTIEDGQVRLQVIEARFGEVRLDNQSRSGNRLLSATLSPLQAGEVIEQDSLDRALLLLSDIPGVVSMATLSPGSQVGTSDLLVGVQPGARVSGQLTADGHGSQSAGRSRAGASLNLINTLGLGDVLSATALSSGKGLNHGGVSYELALNGLGTRFGVGISSLRYELIGGLAKLDAHGTAHVLSAVLRQPLVRRSNANLSAALTIDRTTLRDRVDVSSIATDRTMHNANLSVHGDLVDGWAGGGLTTADAGVLTGRVGFDKPAAQLGDAASAQTEGGFTKWTLNVSRVQSVGASGSLHLSARAQRASCNLDASQKLSVGGPSGVRGYDSGAAPGDEGEIFSAEYRHTMRLSAPGLWQATVFADTARVRINAKPFAAGSNHLRLSGAGVGLNWGLDAWQARLAVAMPVGAVPSTMDATRTTRGWIDISRQF
jgi:hemolysin activation/secretion protein